MAGLFDDLTTTLDPVRVAEANAKLREQAEIQRLQDRFGRGTKPLVQAGVDFATTFGRSLAKGILGDEPDPEVALARKQAELAKTISGLEGDRTSAAFAMAAAQEAKLADRPDLALRFATAGGERAKAEAAALAKAGASKAAQRRAELTGLGSVARNEFLATNPSYLSENLGISPEAALEISNGIAEQNNLRRLKLQSDLNDVTKATATKVTGTDIDQIVGHLANNGIDKSSFGFTAKDEDVVAFATPIASEVRRRMDIARDKGQRGNEAAITQQVLQELVQSGAVEVSPQFFGGEQGELNIDSVNKIRFNDVMTAGSQAAPTAAVPKDTPTPAPKTFDFDFSK